MSRVGRLLAIGRDGWRALLALVRAGVCVCMRLFCFGGGEHAKDVFSRWSVARGQGRVAGYEEVWDRTYAHLAVAPRPFAQYGGLPDAGHHPRRS